MCLGLHSEMFFPPLDKDERTAPEAHYYALGKYVCEHCPVIEDCRKAGKDEEYGLWGGQTPKDRRHGKVALNKTYLPLQYIDSMPPSSDIPLFVPEVRQEVRQVLKRRSRKR